MKSEFITTLSGDYMDDKTFILTKDLVYVSKLLNTTILVPEGFVTDFASVPRVPVAYTLFGNRAHHESVLHDFLYFSAITKREKSDKVFLEAMKIRGKSWFVRWSMYLGVKCGGWKAWNDHRKAGHPNGV